MKVNALEGVNVSVDSRQISPKVSLMLRILDLRSLARLTNMSGKV